MSSTVYWSQATAFHCVLSAQIFRPLGCQKWRTWILSLCILHSPKILSLCILGRNVETQSFRIHVWQNMPQILHTQFSYHTALWAYSVRIRCDILKPTWQKFLKPYKPIENSDSRHSFPIDSFTLKFWHSTYSDKRGKENAQRMFIGWNRMFRMFWQPTYRDRRRR